MGRFRNLEFDDEPERKAKAAPVPKHAPSCRDAGYYIAKADAERRQWNCENALRYYSRALESNVNTIEGWIGQIQMLVQLEEYPEAELWSRKALDRYKNQPDLLAGRCQACCRLGQTTEAYRWSDLSLEQAGESGYRWQARGELMLSRDRGTASRCFEKAILINPDWLVSLEIGVIYLHYRYPSKAAGWLEKAIGLANDSAICWLFLARAQKDMGMPARARESLEACLRLSPRHAEATRELVELDHDTTSLTRRLARRWFSR